MTTHNLKTWSCYFIEVLAGNKTFELRKNDRNYKVGDTLNLIEVDEINFELDPINQTKHYLTTGRTHTAKITYILEGGQFGLDKNSRNEIK
jgi:hypothetical protein